MIKIMRPVIDFLNRVHDESKAYHNKKLSEKYLQDKIDSTPLKNYTDVRRSLNFSGPTKKQKAKKTNEVVIRYTRTDDKVEKLKKIFKVSSPKKVGEKTFDYTYERESEE